MSVQGHMIPDSDGEALKAFIIYKVFPYPLPLAALTTCLWREWAGISLQLNLSKVKPCVLCVLEGSPLPIQVLLVQYSPHALLV